MRIVNFFDGAESETTPTIGNIVASDLVRYPDDATYEATELGAPDGGNIYFNTTDNTIRYYNGTAWQELIDESTTQAVENKAIDADNNLITNIDNNEIKPLAGIEATKLADGSVSDTEFQYINSVTSNVQDQIDSKQSTSEKGVANGYASLDGTGKVPASELPSYVDDVLEYANFAALPVTGETGKIYVTLDDNKTFRWTGSVYVEVGPASQANNNSLEEGGNWSVVSTPGGAGQSIVQTANDASGLGLNQDFYVAQTFTPGANFTVNRAEIKMYDNGGSTGTYQLEIWDTLAGGNPDSTSVIATSDTVLASSIGDTSPGALIEFVFSTPPNLISGTKYALVMNPSSSTGNYTVRQSDNADPYAGGDIYYTNTPASTSWTSDTNSDLVFTITEDTTAGSVDLTWSTDAYVQQEGFDKTRNTIQASTTSFTGTDDIAYVTVNKTTDAVTNLTVNTAEMASYSPGDDDLIIYRLIEGGVEVARKLYLNDGDSAQLEDGISPSTGNAWSDLVDADIIPDGPGRDVGSLAQPFDQTFSDSVFVEDASLATRNNNLAISGANLRTESSTVSITVETIGNNDANANATEDVYILTGNKTAGTGDSGDIIAQTGSSVGGSRGQIVLKDGTEGTSGHVWTSTGVNGEGSWSAPAGTSSGSLISKQIFTASGTWNKPVGVNTVIVEVLAGGGAGGSGDNTIASAMSTGSGGGAGGYTKEEIDVTGTSSETITIGAGGTGTAQLSGGAGGTSSFGAFCSATGGAGGIGTGDSTTTRIAAGVFGGNGQNGDFNGSGGPSQPGWSTASAGGIGVVGGGGDCLYGGGGPGEAFVLASGSVGGNAGTGYGSGGGASGCGESTTAIAGGNGSNGLIIVWEYS